MFENFDWSQFGGNAEEMKKMQDNLKKMQDDLKKQKTAEA